MVLANWLKDWAKIVMWLALAFAGLIWMDVVVLYFKITAAATFLFLVYFVVVCYPDRRELFYKK